MQERLRIVGEYDVHGRPEQSETETADSVLNLVESLQSGRGGWAEHVVFTGRIDDAAAVDDRDTGVALSSLKDFVRTLYDYARTGYAGSMHAYLRDESVQSFRCTFTRWAPTESQTVQSSPRLAGMRRFPVPVEVDPSGVVFMFAHFKVNGLGTFRPRLHYYDDTSKSGKVYIGYIGRHLETPGTN
ncbi:hypothetical protein [Kineococcus arenarius]|uniref:hypothetical protein n=1 Tax=Kineococcus sp. SYSU DK007 TaxID=3383128 RepID=UPI003D7D5931